ncbi:MAG: c-type cytochrome [Lewinellaceae bacterium]|nr:c-type cytochrome [Lewinellaceae bacterium]
MDLKRFTAYALFLCFFLATGIVSAQDAAPAVDLTEGETLFKNNCAACHNKNMKDNLTGPALGGVQDRWADYPRKDLYSWVNNSQALINSGHPRAVELWNQWKPTVMSNFNFSDQQIENILAYVNDVYTRVPVVAVTPGGGTAAPQKPNNTLLFLGLFALLAVVALVLARIISNLDYLAKVQETGEAPPRKTLAQILTSKGIIAFVVFLVVVLGGYTTVNNAINLGRQQGYQPDQPIKFSHLTHAGTHKIDCNYCHDGARRSKHSVIPAANTCMNCHKAIKVGSTYGTAEISKIYASIGFDPNTDKYIEHYDAMSQADIEKIFKKWFSDNYIKEKNTLDAEGELLVKNQWEDLVASLTNPGKDKVQGPIEWIRIHNLPDHVYFNHSQHVTVGKLTCQTCHGTVEAMEVVQQFSPLSMGWCVNCHRKTEVQFANNPYYEAYKKYHEEMASGKRDKVTVEEIGGVECQKCHY